MRNFSTMVLFTVSVVFAASGASCPHRQANAPVLPSAFVGPPTLDEVIRQVNSNSARIQTLRARGAALTVPGLPSLRTELALQRPLHFRMRADTALVGTVLDLGSNEDMFWMWVSRAEPRAVYFCRHEQFYNSAARQVLPVEPSWLISALGVVEMDPLGRHSGPRSAGPGRLEVTSLIPTTQGELIRVLILHDLHGTILEQHMYDAQQKLLASAYASQHRQEPILGVTLPHRVDLRIPSTNMSFAINVDDYEVNGQSGNQQHLWQMPKPSGYPLVDLAAPGIHLSKRVMPSTKQFGNLTTPDHSTTPASTPRSARGRPNGFRRSWWRQH